MTPEQRDPARAPAGGAPVVSAAAAGGDGSAAGGGTRTGAWALLSAPVTLLESACLWVSYLALFLLMSATTIDALSRYFFTAPLLGVHELVEEFFMPAIVYMSIAYLYRNGVHVRITLFSDRLPEGVQRALMLVFNVMTMALFAIAAWGLAIRTWDAWVMREYSASPLNYMIWPSYGLVALGSALMTVRVAQAVLAARHPAPQHLVHE